MNDRPKRRTVSEALRAARAEEERARAEYMADIESTMQAVRWAMPESMMQAVRWAMPVDLAIAATEGVLQHPGALPFDGLTISGDHRPRHGRLYARGIGGDEG